MKTELRSGGGWLPVVCLSLVFLISAWGIVPTARAGELIQNGEFDEGSLHWKVGPRLGSWLPFLEGGRASLTPLNYQYSGPLIYQNMNIGGVAGKSLALTLLLEKVYAYEGNPVAVGLDYATEAGQVKRLTAWNPNYTALADGTNSYSASVVVPAEAARLVRVVVSRMARGGDFVLHSISLSGSGLSLGSVPSLSSISPATGPYYSVTNSGRITLKGVNFGSSTGQVFVGSAPVDLVGKMSSPMFASAVVESWTPTQVVAHVVEPMTSGKVFLLANSVESDGNLMFTITSPHFVLTADQPTITILRGQKIEVPFRLDLLNGFTSKVSGISMMTTMPMPTPPVTPPLFRSGGFNIPLDTSLLAQGQYEGLAQSLEDSSYARFAPFVIEVRTTAAIKFTTNTPPVEVSALQVGKQGDFTYDFDWQLIDNTGAEYLDQTSDRVPRTVVVSSDNPSVVQVANDNWGPRFLAHASGSANLTFTTADGVSRSLPVTVGLPASPRFDTGSVSPAIADNSGNCTNVFYWQATQTPDWVGYDGMASFSFDGLSRNSDDHSATWVVPVPAGTPPGTYLFHAMADSAARYVTLDVVNASTHGQIAGTVVTVGSEYSHGAMGELQWYNATTGNPVGTNMVSSHNTAKYLASFIPPGTYRVCWTSYASSGSAQWYPMARSFEEASNIVVTAGNTVSNINFTLRAEASLPSDLNVPAPVFNGSELTFAVETENGLTYVLEYKESLQDTAWKVAQTITGNGDPLILADPNAPTTRRFYRLSVVRD